HRGNINGPSKDENRPSYIDLAIKKGYDVEIDLRIDKNQLYLGHDTPDYLIDIYFLLRRQNKLWIHCKDIDSLIYCSTHLSNANYFWHQEDDYTLTSKGYIWVYPGKPIPFNLIDKCVCVMPEVNDTFAKYAYAICTDYCESCKL